MWRREVYATTGPRLLVQLWRGREFEAKDGLSRLPAEIRYTKGVPMGGDLTNAPAGKSPLSGNLDRIQVVMPPVGNTVNVKEATWTNTIGDPELIAVWTDPDFDPKQRAFYYLHVLEIATPRWTAYDAKRFGVQMDPKVPMSLQERAYTSPIWYTP